MTTIRVKHTQKFTTIANATLQDRRLSLKSRGLHHLLLSYPDNWEVKVEHLARQCDKDGKAAITSAKTGDVTFSCQMGSMVAGVTIPKHDQNTLAVACGDG